MISEKKKKGKKKKKTNQTRSGNVVLITIYVLS